MSAPCILPESYKSLREDLKSKGLSLVSLRKMTTDERIKLFGQHFNVSDKDNTAVWFNKKYESKLLLPNQIESLQKWADKLKKQGLNNKSYKLLYEKISGMKAVYNPKQGKPFLSGLAKSKLGFEIDIEDARKVYEASRSLTQQKKQLDKLSGKDFTTLTHEEFVEFIKNTENNDLRLKFGKNQQKLQLELEQAYGKSLTDNTFWDKLFGTFKVLKAAWDVSFGRQLTGIMAADIKNDGQNTGFNGWVKGMQATFGKSKEINGTQAMNEIKAQIYSHPYYLSGAIKEIGINLGGQDSEFFPENFITGSRTLDKTNWTRWIKEGFKASERGMEAGLLWAKFQTAIAAINKVSKDTKNLSDAVKILNEQDFGRKIEKLFGRYEPMFKGLKILDGGFGKIVDRMLFAPKFVAAQIARYADIGLVGKFAASKVSDKVNFNLQNQIRLKASLMSIGLLTALPIILSSAIQAALYPDDDDDFWEDMLMQLENRFDPRSNSFGKLEIGKYVHLDLSVGVNRLISLTAQVITGKKKDNLGLIRRADKIKEVSKFLEYKLSPTISNGRLAYKKLSEWLITGEQAEDVVGQPVHDWQIITQVLLPINLQTAIEGGVDVYNTPPEERLGLTLAITAGVISDSIGLSASIYEKTNTERNTDKSDDIIRKEIDIAKNNPTPSGYSTTTPSSVIAANSVLAGNKKAELEFTKEFLKQEKSYLNSVGYKRDSWELRNKKIKSIRTKVMNKLKKKYVAKKRKKK